MTTVVEPIIRSHLSELVNLKLSFSAPYGRHVLHFENKRYNLLLFKSIRPVTSSIYVSIFVYLLYIRITTVPVSLICLYKVPVLPW